MSAAGVRGLASATLATVLVAVSACVAACAESPVACYEGDALACTCEGGGAGYARCLPGQGGYGACTCAPAASADASAGDAGDAGDAAPDPSAKLGMLERCVSNDQCETGLCFSFNVKGMLCTKPCKADADCPAPSTGCNNQGICKAP